MNLVEYLKIVTEASNYLAMFNDMIRNHERGREFVEPYISWAKTNLKKNDRIVWFLRWVRVEIAQEFNTVDPKAKKAESKQAELKKLNKRLGTGYTSYDMLSMSALKQQLVHYLGLPIPKLQEVVWDRQSPKQLIDQFKEIENEWKQTSDRRNLLEYEAGDEPKVVMQFPDGFAWFDLNTNSCDQEARAMGHCGNAGGNRGDTILSLRKLVKKIDDYTYWYPVLTFILDTEGNLGEMKGRNNDKPIPKYHPYIIALLKNYRAVKAIKGGGYLPEHNFKLSDLSPDVRRELSDLKPGLAELDELYMREGMSSKVLNRIHNELEHLSSGEYDAESKVFIVKTWKNFEAFLTDVYDETAHKILELALGEADFQIDHHLDNLQADFHQAVLEFPPHWQERVIRRAGLTISPNSSITALCDQAVKMLISSDDEWFVIFRELYTDHTRIQNEAWERLAAYADAGWTWACSQAYDNIPSDEKAFMRFVLNKEEVKLMVPELDMIYYAMSSEEDENDYGNDLSSMRGESAYPSWDRIEGDYQHEKRKEAGLVNDKGKDEWLEGLEKGGDAYLSNEYLILLQGGRTSSTISDERQHKLPLEGGSGNYEEDDSEDLTDDIDLGRS